MMPKGLRYHCSLLATSMFLLQFLATESVFAKTPNKERSDKQPEIATPNAAVAKTERETEKETETQNETQTYAFQPKTKEAKDILAIIEEMATACSHQDITVIAKHMHPDVTSINEKTKTLVSSKDNVIEYIGMVFKQYSPEGKTPLVSYQIKQPFIHVHGKEAIATYIGIAKIGGDHPTELKSRINEVLVNDNNQWQIIHHRSHWDHDRVLNPGSDSPSQIEQTINPDKYKNLTGGVKTLLLNLSQIKAIGTDINSARRSVWEIRKEASRKELEVTESTDSSDSAPTKASKQNCYLAPRANLLKNHYTHLDTVVNTMAKDIAKYKDGALKQVDRVDISTPVNTILDGWQTKLDLTKKHLDSLQRLAKSAPFDNESIIRIADLLENDLNAFKEDQKTLVKAFEKQQ